MANRGKTGKGRRTGRGRKPQASGWQGKAARRIGRAVASFAGHVAALALAVGLLAGLHWFASPETASDSETGPTIRSLIAASESRPASTPPARPMPRPPAAVGEAMQPPDTSIRTGALPAPPRARPAATSKGGAIRTAMPVCGSGARRNCVVDGDTIWLDGEKIRLETINAPETKGECLHESLLAKAATNRLSTLLSGAAFDVERSGVDRYGRTLARLTLRDGEAGDLLVEEGLAHRWRGRKESWCRA